MGKDITIHLNERPIYDIVIRRDFEDLKGSFEALGFKGRKVCIVTDSNVGPLYAQAVKAELDKTGNSVFVYTIPAGEENKNLDTVQDVLEFLVNNRFDRNDCLAALGGGVVGDLTGYTAASYMRGIAFIQIPTTLLAQTDSSIGGKTGVDFRAYKNMVGAFHQPKLVYMNMSTLRSLDERLFNSGFGEILKHGLIKDMEYFKWLDDNSADIRALDMDALEQMIYRSCQIKQQVVELDPTEKGDRALLNFGHTLGHAIEKAMNFTMYHGECVVLGMIAALRLSVMKGLISHEEEEMAVNTFASYNFPMSVEGLSCEQILAISKSDKKMDADKIKFILLRQMGDAYIDKNVSNEELLTCLERVIK